MGGYVSCAEDVGVGVGLDNNRQAGLAGAQFSTRDTAAPHGPRPDRGVQ